jgi:hypothetical protein
VHRFLLRNGTFVRFQRQRLEFERRYQTLYFCIFFPLFTQLILVLFVETIGLIRVKVYGRNIITELFHYTDNILIIIVEAYGVGSSVYMYGQLLCICMDRISFFFSYLCNVYSGSGARSRRINVILNRRTKRKNNCTYD